MKFQFVYKINNYGLLLIVTLFLLLLTLSTEYILNTEELIYNFYSEKLAHEQVQHLLKKQEKWSLVSYIIIPILILLRTSLVTFCLSVGLFIYNLEIKSKNIFRIALKGEFILGSVGLFKILYFYFLKKDHTFEDLQQFYPFSYTNFLNLNYIEPWLIYPLQTINLFEIAYFFVLVYGLNNLLKNKFSKCFEIVTISYGTGLIIWICLVMFLTLNLT